MKKTDDCKRINAEFDEFLNAPPLTEKEYEVFSIGFNIAILKDAMARAMDKSDNHCYMAEYNTQLDEIRAWEERKETLIETVIPILNSRFLKKIISLEKEFGSNSKLFSILRKASAKDQGSLDPVPQQTTENKEGLTCLSDTKGGGKIITNKNIKAEFFPACLNTVFCWAKKAGIKIEMNNGVNEMMIEDASALKAAHQKYYDTKRKKMKKSKN